MSEPKHKFQGLNSIAIENLFVKEYNDSLPLHLQIKETPICVKKAYKEYQNNEELKENWIPGVELIPRKVFTQRQRGYFGEICRTEEGILGEVGFKAKQWSSALMHSNTGKGFHIHPPFIPDNTNPKSYFNHHFIEEPSNYSLRKYDREQWDAIFFLNGMCEVILIDEREGLPRNILQFLFYGDNYQHENHFGVLIPAGVGHAFFACSSENVVMVYGTSLSFDPENEGRIAHQIESPNIPKEWKKYINR